MNLAALDRASDIFSCCALLYRMLLGRPLTDAELMGTGLARGLRQSLARAQELPDACDVLLWVFPQVRRHIVGRGHLHAAKFIELEIFLMDAHPLLRTEHRAGIVHLNGNHDEQVQP